MRKPLLSSSKKQIERNLKMDNKVIFPFTPNERVKAAFRNKTQMRRAVKIMTEASLPSIL